MSLTESEEFTQTQTAWLQVAVKRAYGRASGLRRQVEIPDLVG